MKFLTRIFSRKRPSAPAAITDELPPLNLSKLPLQPAPPISYHPERQPQNDAQDESFSVAVVGESHYQAALTTICHGKRTTSADLYFTAWLVPEPTNPHDPNAVIVQIQQQTVGYLKRSDATKYKKLHGNQSTRCEANIRGGWDRGDDQGQFGVWLDLIL